jgi:hypothetical protein
VTTVAAQRAKRHQTTDGQLAQRTIYKIRVTFLAYGVLSELATFHASLETFYLFVSFEYEHAIKSNNRIMQDSEK